jgi:hypothetical protein
MNHALEWRTLALLLALFAAWAFVALAPGCDGRPRPAVQIPARPDRGTCAWSLARARAADAVKAGRMTLLEGAAAFRNAERDNADAPAPDDLDAYCGLAVAWVRGPCAEVKTRPDLADLLEAERAELRREGLLQLPAR